MQQDHNETFRTFAARVQEKEQTCEFKTSFDGSYSNCLAVYHGDVYYTEEVIRDNLLKGITDINIQRDALNTDNIQMKSVTDVITYAEYKETALKANPLTSIFALLAYRCSNNQASQKGKHVKTVPCPLVTSTNPELLTSFIAIRYLIFSQRNPEDGIANPTLVVRPAR